MGRERCSEVLDTKARQAVSMFDDDPRRARISEQPGETRALRVQAGTHLGHDLVDRQAVFARPSAHATGLALEIVSLVVRAHPAVGDGPAVGNGRRVVLDHDRARRQPPCRYGHRALAKPPIGSLGMDAVRTGPRGELHAAEAYTRSLTFMGIPANCSLPPCRHREGDLTGRSEGCPISSYQK